jgi:hypothetical protein
MSALHYPGAVYRPLREATSEPVRNHTQLIFHSAVSAADSLYAFFNRTDVVVESHFYVQDDGDCEQYIPANREADANYLANRRALSVETWDKGNPNILPWNERQMARLVDIAVWAHREKGIPLIRAPRWDAPGMGGHTDYTEWSNVRGKTCPGTARKPQVQIIIDRARAIVNGGTYTPPQPGPVQPAPAGRENLKWLQSLLGVTPDGLMGPITEAAMKRNYIGWQKAVNAFYGRAVALPGNGNRELVRWVQKNCNRRFGYNMQEDGLTGPATNHAIVVGLGQRDSICGPNGFKAALL